MKTSQKGIEFIKSFETLQTQAYKAVPTEQYYTIGYGHYGPDVIPGTTITETRPRGHGAGSKQCHSRMGTEAMPIRCPGIAGVQCRGERIPELHPAEACQTGSR